MPNYRYYRLIEGGPHTCSMCVADAIIQTPRKGERFCLECGRKQMDFSTGDPEGLFKLLDMECFSTPTQAGWRLSLTPSTGLLSP